MSGTRRHRPAWVIGDSSSSAASRLLKLHREDEEYELNPRRKDVHGNGHTSTRSLNTVSTVASALSRQGGPKEKKVRFARGWGGLANAKKQRKTRRPSLSGAETVYTMDSHSASSRGGEDNSRRRLRDLAEGAVINPADCDMVDNELVSMRLKASSFRLKGNREERSGAALPTTVEESPEEHAPAPAPQVIPEDNDDIEDVMSMAWRQPSRVRFHEKIEASPASPVFEDIIEDDDDDDDDDDDNDDDDDDDDSSESMEKPVTIEEEDDEDEESSDSMEAPLRSPVEGNADDGSNVYMTEALRHALTAYAMQQTASSVDFLSSSLQAPLPPVVFADSRNNSTRSIGSPSNDLRAD